jgi:P4 family phage/plasmid primase-like protien
MKNEITKYSEKNLITFSINIAQKLHKSGTWKKDIVFPHKWQDYTLTKSYYNENYNGLALPTGKINNIIVIDIDNIYHWEMFLREHNHKEPDTVSAISGSGGKHLYFKYSEDFEEIKSNSKCFGNEYDIDIRTNGGCIIAPPTKYYNKNVGKEVEYIWEKSIFDHEIKSIPLWIKKLLLNKKQNDKNMEMTEKKNKIAQQNKLEENIKKLQSTNGEIEINEEDNELDFSADEIETLINMLSENRWEDYNDWVNIGMCLFNINKHYLNAWIRWSKKSDKYADGDCEKKWKSFKKTKEGLKIGSLLLWAKKDSPLKYEMFIKKKKLNGMIYSKYPDDKLVLGDTIVVNEKCQYTQLKNRECLIKGCEHDDMKQTMYVEVIDKFMTIKCRHPECFGKTYPCNHILMTKNEMNIAFNGDITININNNQDDELVEFQQIDIYEDPKVNELVFNGLNGKPYQFAELIYYYYENMFNYGEDENWYIYNEHKWENIGKKNMNLRHFIQLKLKDLYCELLRYYKENDIDKQKIKALKNTINLFGETTLKNNIMTELTELYSINKNPKRDFTKKLDSNNYLIGFDNGIYDLRTFEFREGHPDDYITMSVGYEYQNHHTEKYEYLLKFLEDIQPNKEERDYMLTYLSIGLTGNLLELFTILTGCGRNGKSKLVELLKITFGDYFGSVQSQLFTRPRPDANSPDPGLLSLIRKRVVIASEPEKNSKLNSGFIKFITGRDSTTLRNCHSNDMVDFTANFITLLICNDIPDCDDIDNAFSKRLRCINFPTEFVSEPTKENQKKMDVNINKNFDYWKLDFILLLIDYYKAYSQKHELKPTNNILKWTDQYKENTDIYLQFLNENTEENKDGHTHCSTLYEVFKDWFKSNNPNAKVPSNKEFVNNMKKHKDVKKIKINGIPQWGIKNLKLINIE